MTLIWLGALLVFVGVLQMAFQPIWRGRLSGRKRLRSGRVRGRCASRRAFGAGAMSLPGPNRQWWDGQSTSALPE
jgi:hypothetical protein